jgi:hypothetical protein
MDTDRHCLRRMVVVVVGMGIALRPSLVGELAVVATATTTAVMEAEAMEAATVMEAAVMEVVAMEVAAAMVAAVVATEGHHRRWARVG